LDPRAAQIPELHSRHRQKKKKFPRRNFPFFGQKTRKGGPIRQRMGRYPHIFFFCLLLLALPQASPSHELLIVVATASATEAPKTQEKILFFD